MDSQSCRVCNRSFRCTEADSRTDRRCPRHVIGVQLEAIVDLEVYYGLWPGQLELIESCVQAHRSDQPDHEVFLTTECLNCTLYALRHGHNWPDSITERDLLWIARNHGVNLMFVLERLEELSGRTRYPILTQH